MIGIETHPVTASKSYSINQLDASSGGDVNIFAFSQGGIILRNATLQWKFQIKEG